jgi:transposase InsO family protein
MQRFATHGCRADRSGNGEAGTHSAFCIGRKVLSWRVSNTMETDFCIAAVAEAIERFGAPEIFNTDQGSQFTSPRFVLVLREAGVWVSMDGRGRWMGKCVHRAAVAVVEV